MAAATKVIAIGDSMGIIFPGETLVHLKVGLGDTVYLTQFPGGMELTVHDEQFAVTMAAARQIIRENRDVLKRLAE
jgi:putative addiction module antidote